MEPPLFEGEPEHCSLCGEPGHTHDDHWLFTHEPVMRLVDRIKELDSELEDEKRGATMAWHLMSVLGERVAQHEGFIERKLGGIPEPEPDYEAMGYPETGAGVAYEGFFEGVLAIIEPVHATIAKAVYFYPLATDKEYPWEHR